MKRLLFGCLALLLASPASAQLMLLGMGPGAAGPPVVGMVTPLLTQAGSSAVFPSNSATNYYSFIGGSGSGGPTSTLVNKQSVIATAGTINNLEVSFPTAITTGSYAISLNLGGSSQTLTCTVQQGAQTCKDSAHPITVAPGNLVAWQITPASTPTTQAGALQISATFTSTVGQESPIFGGLNNNTVSGSAINYSTFGAAPGAAQTTENLASSVIPAAGTIDQLYAQFPTAVGASATYQVVVEHGGSDTSLTCTTATNGLSCSDTNIAHAFTVAQGDTISIKSCPSNTATCPAGSAPSARQIAVGVRWVPTTSNQALLMSIATTVPSSAATRFTAISGSSNNATTETDFNIGPSSGGFTLSNLTMAVSPTPSTSKTIVLRGGLVSQTPTCTITNPATSCSDNTHSYVAAPSSYLTMQLSGTSGVLTYFKSAIVATASTAYVGPLDAVTASPTSWWGLRCPNVSKASAAQAIRITRASDSTQSDIGYTAACNLDVATASTFCASTTCSVNTLYDQVGAVNLTQATAANQPALTFNCVGSLPCLTFTASSSQVLGNTSFTTSSTAVSMYGVAARVSADGGNTAQSQGILDTSDTGAADNWFISFDSASQALHAHCGASCTGLGFTGPATEGNLHTVLLSQATSSQQLYVDGQPLVTGSTTATQHPSANSIMVGCNSSSKTAVSCTASTFLGGLWLEGGVMNAAINQQQQLTLNNNSHTYWGF